MRGTDDTSYKFPKDVTDAERSRIFREVIDAQVKMTGELAPKDRPPMFHFTMYNEMLNEYLKDSAAFGLPRNVIVVWTDDNDGAMRFLPADKGQWKHGVYYHLAYLGQVAKQNAHIVTPARIATEFRKIIDAGATEYMLVNVSELREFVMEARMIGEIAWDGNVALKETAKQPRPSEVKPFVPSTREAREAASQPAS
jgi:hypothetical protein